MAFKKDIVELIDHKKIFVGTADAPVTILEYGEYENEDCAKANDVVKQVLQNFEGKVKFTFRHFPLTRVHQRSMKAAEAAVAAVQDGKFWEMHNVMFENRRNLGTVSLKLHSKEAGISNKNFLNDLVNGTYGWQVQDDLREGIALGVKDLPAFFINEERLDGKPTYANISAAIEAALKKGKKKAPQKQVA